MPSKRGSASLSFPVLVAALTLAPAVEAPAAEFLRGDKNRDGKVDLSDAIDTLVWLFQGGGFGPICLDAWDADDSGKVDLSDTIFTLIFLFRGGSRIPPPYPGCGEDPTEDLIDCGSYDACPAPGAAGRLVASSGCGGFIEGKGGGGAAGTGECVEYSWSAGVLSLRHRDLGLSCCVDVAAGISVDGGTIEIAESEAPWPDGPCKCLCLYDADYEVTGLVPGPCLIRFTGSLGGDLEILIDTGKEPSGTVCAERSAYPWGE